MTTRTADTSPLVRARVAGFLYLGLGLFGPFSLLYVPSTLIVRGDAATTAQNLMASESLFRLSIVSALLEAIVYIFVVLALYQLLKPVNKNMAWLMVIFVLLAVPIRMLNELNPLAVLLLLSGADYLKVFTADQLQALVMLFLDLHRHGILVASIFWGFWLLPFGLLVYKSGFLPRILGVLLIIACFGYLVNSLTHLLFPGYGAVVARLATVLYFGELPIVLWLLIKGVNVEQWEKRALESA
ncbi:MAG TPA: DUF4386 domain-containing protein [Anaerolineae bacterium]|nr:DUF4386 domain-containing protein [Anaerolineae bacterium]